MSRFGIGYDAHPLVEGRALVLGGVHVPHDRGLQGHSDGDALAHALIDALLGAAALGDIGTHFPPEKVSEGASSVGMLERTAELVRAAGWRVGNVDATIIAQRPRLAEHIVAMRTVIATALGLPLGDVSVKATTEDGLGYTGRGDGIAAMAVASLEPAS